MQPKTLRFFQLHNPFYLLSALCMLLGCFGLAHSLRMASGHIETLLVLMTVVQAYEFLLTGLAWHLITTRGAERDGRMLLLLELVFLVDATYLNAELSAADVRIGALVGFLTLALAVIKVRVMFRALGLPLRAKAYTFLVALFVALLGIPLVSAQMFHQDLLNEIFFYGVWWVVGLLPLLHVGIADEFRARALRTDWLQPIERNFRIAFMVFPSISVLWHAASMHWVYGVPFHASYWSPIVLGLGVSISLLGVRWFPRLWCMRVRWLTPIVALLWSINPPQELILTLPSEIAADLLVSPLRVALLAAALVYFLSFWSERWRPFFLSGIASLLLAGAGHSISSIMAHAARAANLLVPKTAVEACVMSIVGAFVFLLVGAAVSLSNNSRPRRLEILPAKGHRAHGRGNGDPDH